MKTPKKCFSCFKFHMRSIFSSFHFPYCHLSLFFIQGLRGVRRRVRVLEIQPTALRQNRWYYKIYCIGLNTLFGSVAPLLSLIYLNICTVLGKRYIKLGSVLTAIPSRIK